MAFHVFHNPDARAGFFVNMFAMPVCTVAVVMRFLSTTRPGRKLGLEDWFALLSLVCMIIYASLETWILVKMNGIDLAEVKHLPKHVIVKIYTLGYVMNIQTPLNQTFAKLSLLVFYHRIFRINRIFAKLVWSVGAIQIAWCIPMLLIRLLQCRPFVGTWDPTIKSKCISSQIILAVGDSINSAIDFVMVAMAIWIVSRLQMPRYNKLKFGFLFALGGFSGVIGIIKIAEAYGSVGSSVRDATWNVSQQATSILCCCAPIYKFIFQKPQLPASWTYLLGSLRRYRTEYANVDPPATSDVSDSNRLRSSSFRAKKSWLREIENSSGKLSGSSGESLDERVQKITIAPTARQV